MLENKFTRYFEQCSMFAKDLELKLIFSIHQTSNTSSQQPYTLPLRITRKFLICGFCNFDQTQILEFVRIYNSKVDYFLVDLEKKGFVGISKDQSKILTGNLEGRLSEIIDQKKIIGIRYDSLTADHLINQLIKTNPFLYKYKIGIVGLGKIGFKIGMSLLECGNNIEVYSRNFDLLYKKCNCMDVIKPINSLARPIPHRYLSSCINDKDIIITATNSKDIITKEFLNFIKPNSAIYTVGHSEISPDVIKEIKTKKSVKISRVDISMSILNYLERFFYEKEIVPKSKTIGDKTYISGGYIGSPGDIVLDDIDNPKLIYGYISNKNEFIRELSKFNG